MIKRSRGLNPAVYWMDIRDKSTYYIIKKSQMGHTKKIKKKSFEGVHEGPPFSLPPVCINENSFKKVLYCETTQIVLSYLKYKQQAIILVLSFLKYQSHSEIDVKDVFKKNFFLEINLKTLTGPYSVFLNVLSNPTIY
jgi:hypothetical protein